MLIRPLGYPIVWWGVKFRGLPTEQYWPSVVTPSVPVDGLGFEDHDGVWVAQHWKQGIQWSWDHLVNRCSQSFLTTNGPDWSDVLVNGPGPILGMRIRVRDQWS